MSRSDGTGGARRDRETDRLRVGVTGTIVEDTIDTVDGVRIEDLGGIAYALHGLSAFLPDGAVAHPVLEVGRDAIERVRRELGGLRAISAGDFRPVRHVNNKVHLVYHPDGSRDETLTGGVPPAGWDLYEPWLDRLDAWLWNFISGMETDLDTFGRVKARFRGDVYMDIHSLCLEHVPGRARRHRTPDRWPDWVTGVRWVQMNEAEAGLLQRGEPRSLPEEAEEALAVRLHGLGVETVLFTLGSRGARLYGADGAIVTEPVPEGEPAVDPTGCGDVFGATLYARLLAGDRVEPAIREATRLAARNATYRGAGG
ncbi:MAG TPA: PfkB family carbohydrate kinase, partial [Gemmatimonadota bacterium]|nr:PfkB family carbohydrate kinase [Gemmatimonadota bacterium]